MAQWGDCICVLKQMTAKSGSITIKAVAGLFGTIHARAKRCGRIREAPLLSARHHHTPESWVTCKNKRWQMATLTALSHKLQGGCLLFVLGADKKIDGYVWGREEIMYTCSFLIALQFWSREKCTLDITCGGTLLYFVSYTGTCIASSNKIQSSLIAPKAHSGYTTFPVKGQKFTSQASQYCS